MALRIDQVLLDTYLYAPAILTAGPMSFAFHFSQASLALAWICCIQSTSREGWCLGLDGGRVRANQASFILNGSAYSAATFTANTWHHAGGIFENNTSRYASLDGVLTQDTYDPGTPSGVNATFIGASHDTLGVNFFAGFTGCLANLGIWNVALTAAEMVSLSAGFSPSKIRPSALVAYLPLLDDTTKIVDLRGNTFTANPGTGTFSNCQNGPALIQPRPPMLFGGVTAPQLRQTYNRIEGL